MVSQYLLPCILPHYGWEGYFWIVIVELWYEVVKTSGLTIRFFQN